MFTENQTQNQAFPLSQTEPPQKGGLDFSSVQLRNLAFVLMLLDHCCYTVGGPEWFSWLGRLAFPIFAFQIAEGFRRTRNVKRYQRRLLLFALLSEIPFNYMLAGGAIYPFHQNVLFTLLLGLLAVEQVDKGMKSQKLSTRMGRCVLLPLLCMAVANFGMTDYSWVGVATVIVFYLFPDKKWMQLLMLLYLNQCCMGGQVYPLFGGVIELKEQALAVLALPLIWQYHGRKGREWEWKPGGKTIHWAYAFYPLHMIVLSLLRAWLWY